MLCPRNVVNTMLCRHKEEALLRADAGMSPRYFRTHLPEKILGLTSRSAHTLCHIRQWHSSIRLVITNSCCLGMAILSPHQCGLQKPFGHFGHLLILTACATGIETLSPFDEKRGFPSLQSIVCPHLGWHVRCTVIRVVLINFNSRYLSVTRMPALDLTTSF